MTEDRPFWAGRLYVQPEHGHAYDEVPCPGVPARRADLVGGVVPFEIDCLPYGDAVAACVEARPDAAPVLSRWRELLDAGFPGWETDQRVRRVATGTPPEDAPEPPTAAKLMTSFENATAPGAAHVVYEIECERFGDFLPSPPPPPVPHENLVRAAHAVMAATRLPRGTGLISLTRSRQGGSIDFAYGGEREDGTPLLLCELYAHGNHAWSLRAAISVTAREVLEEQVAFWQWPWLRPYLGRVVFAVDDHEFERDRYDRYGGDAPFDIKRRLIELAGAAADMAVRGERRAVVTSLREYPVRCQVVDLMRLDTVHRAADRLTDADGMQKNWLCRIEPFEVYRLANRYFVHRGEIVGSAPIHDKATPLDREAVDGFDRRLATLVPNTVDGRRADKTVEDEAVYDAHTLFAKTLVAEAATFGILDFAVDIGTNRNGLVEAIRVVSLWGADMLSFDPGRLVDGVLADNSRNEAMLASGIETVAAGGGHGRYAYLLPLLVEEYGKDAFVANLTRAASGRWTSATGEDRAAARIAEVLTECLVHVLIHLNSDDDRLFDEETREQLADDIAEVDWSHFAHNFLFEDGEDEFSRKALALIAERITGT